MTQLILFILASRLFVLLDLLSSKYSRLARLKHLVRAGFLPRRHRQEPLYVCASEASRSVWESGARKCARKRTIITCPDFCPTALRVKWRRFLPPPNFPPPLKVVFLIYEDGSKQACSMEQSRGWKAALRYIYLPFKVSSEDRRYNWKLQLDCVQSCKGMPWKLD